MKLSRSPTLSPCVAVALFLAICGGDAFTARYSRHAVIGSVVKLSPETLARKSRLLWVYRKPRKNSDGPYTLNSLRPSFTALTMGLFDFLNSREGDFIPLRSSDDDAPYGPGPLILMYAVPKSIHDEELLDMVADGMPDIPGVVIRRIEAVVLDGDNGREAKGDDLLDLTVQEALDVAFKEGGKVLSPIKAIKEFNTEVVSTQKQPSEEGPCPVLYFSGVTNIQMMSTYRIIANEVYQETNGIHWPACAKVVQPAMQKPLRQVLMEISGDHADAMKVRKEESEQSNED